VHTGTVASAAADVLAATPVSGPPPRAIHRNREQLVGPDHRNHRTGGQHRLVAAAADTVTPENHLHHHFASRRVNWINNRREFFFTTPSEVRQVLATRVGGLLECNDTREATEYFQS